MNTKVLITLLGLAAVAIPAVAPASQPAARQPQAPVTLSAAKLLLLLTDPAAAPELRVVLPARFTTLDPAIVAVMDVP